MGEKIEERAEQGEFKEIKPFEIIFRLDGREWAKLEGYITEDKLEEIFSYLARIKQFQKYLSFVKMIETLVKGRI